jgi:phosphoribosylformylglycinamidine synthase subunit PurQ / glutaminase
MKSKKINILVLTGYGINAEKELAWAFSLAGGNPSIIHLEDVIENKDILKNFQIIAFPGGFSFGDHIASGRVFANIIKNNLMDELSGFIDRGNLLIGICNGFQIIVKLGIIPDFDRTNKQSVSLIENDSGNFENRWVHLKVFKNKSPWLNDINSIYLPVRHGEGKFVCSDETLSEIIRNEQVVMRYVNPDSESVQYPHNPNGSIDNIAGIINSQGNVFGLMPHPEASIFKENHPKWTEKRNLNDTLGLKIFENGINFFK